MARFERRAVVVLSLAALAACNAIAGLGEFQDVPAAPDAEAGATDGAGAIDEDSPGASEDSGQDGAAPVDAGLDAPSVPDTGPVDAGPPPDATSTVDLRWPRWIMPNGAEAGLQNPARYVAVGDGGAVDLVTGLTWSAPVSATSLPAARESCPYPTHVPTRIELVSILDTSQSPPLVNPVFTGFPAASLWTSSVTPDGRSWTVDFAGGVVAPSSSGASSVACVLAADGGAP
jgi:hypothetical protein